MSVAAELSERSPRPPWVDELEHRVSCAAALRNVADGALVALAAEVLRDGRWQVSEIHSPVQWLMWKVGLSRHTARQVVRLASRAEALPVTVGLLAEGKLSLDQATTVARYTPSEYEASVCDLAVNATVNQIATATRGYDFDTDARREPRPRGREMAFGTDEDGTWWARVRLAADEGSVVEDALRTTRDRLHAAARAEAKDAAAEAGRPGTGTDAQLGVPQVGWADALVGMANAVAATNAAGAETGARAQVHLHLELPTGGDGEHWRAELHGGPRLPDPVRRYLLCDCDIEIVWQQDGTPVSVGRRHRTPSRRLRRLIEHRDHHHCRVPGCDRTLWLQVHHIQHWEDGGPTDTANLVCLCERHHRLHHQGRLGITGDAAEPDGLTFTNASGLILDRAGLPRAFRPGDPIPDITPYDGPTGERLHKAHVHFGPATTTSPPGARTPAA